MESDTPLSLNTYPQLALELSREWVNWLERLMLENKWPLSGDVSQWISAWSEAVGQIGLFNINTVGAANPQLERRIGLHYSYGRQIGRMLDVLTPLVTANEAMLEKTVGEKKLNDFTAMVSDIQQLKRLNSQTTDDIVREVNSWRESLTPDEFNQRLQGLLNRLNHLPLPSGMSPLIRK